MRPLSLHRIRMVRPLAVVASVADVLLVRSWLVDGLDVAAILALHAAAVVTGGLLQHLLDRSARSETLALAFLALLLGPVGGLALLVADLGKRMARVEVVHRAAGEGNPSSAAERVHAQIAQNRRHPGVGTRPEDFAEIFRSGSLAEQQAAISAISRSYHPQMRPALSRGLASEVPALRVQSAAVYARLRGTFGARAKALLEAGAAASASEALHVAESGFLDAETAERLTALAAELRARKGAGEGARSPTTHAAIREALAPPPRIRRYSCGGVA